ncbi:MAG: SDR family NAD(P)-dependent oxidoreductase, partial [Acidobacteria bacterium]|nr:SDR family NAD(P)-dependent oxidoreductase [Acidobacteriota bacterium]
MPFDAKHALITGGSRGIGRGIALKLAEKGARVAINYFENEAAAQDT